MNKENCALKLVDEIILYQDARSKKHQTYWEMCDNASESNELDTLWALFMVLKKTDSITVL